MTNEYTGQPVKIGVIGGTGLYQMDGLADLHEVDLTTPYGNPSDTITIGSLDGVEVAFLPRHGRGHRILPSEIPVRANIYALKMLGVERLLSVSAVGSLKQDIAPLDMVVPDQIIDRTRQRPSTFFGEGLVAHVAYGEPFCAELSDLLAVAADDTEATIHRGGTYLVMEGPAFSTRAESQLYQSWGASIIGMTASPEAKLAREAEMCFAVLATATDYDAWHQSHAAVTAEMVLANLAKNATTSQAALRKLMPRIPKQRHCGCGAALATALVTAQALVPEQTLQKLGPLVSKYMS
jgi:5'-methylthioadenosine phosphorylase